MEWNVENLFDCADDSLKQDEEFLPTSERRWTWGRYWRKMDNVARVVMGVGHDSPPALVALCEVENDSVMIHLTRRSPLQSVGYRYVMTDSPDVRGIDVALMYQPEDFRLVDYASVRVPSQEHGLRPTRDILHAWGTLTSGDTLHVVVCHMPSKAGNSRASSQNRRLALATLQHLVDSLGQSAKVVVMGDFNDGKVRLSGMERHTPKSRGLEGSYRFRGVWEWIDHIMTRNISAEGTSLRYEAEWLQEKDSNGGWHPRRTFKGATYAGGVSDHVPIFLDITF